MSSSPPTPAANYYGQGPVLRLARLGLVLTQQLWPGLAVRAALRLFGTPLPPRWLRRSRPWPAHWRHERWPFERAGLTLYRDERAGPRAPAVLLVHGWGGHAGQMLPLAEALGQAGLQVLLLEMPAHGRSAGRTSNLPQFAQPRSARSASLAKVRNLKPDAPRCDSPSRSAPWPAASPGWCHARC